MSSWSDALAVFVVRPRCPHCGCLAYISIRSMPTESDGSKTMRVVCKRCSGRYLIVSEVAEPDEMSDCLPCFGNIDTLTP